MVGGNVRHGHAFLEVAHAGAVGRRVRICLVMRLLLDMDMCLLLLQVLVVHLLAEVAAGRTDVAVASSTGLRLCRGGHRWNVRALHRILDRHGACGLLMRRLVMVGRTGRVHHLWRAGVALHCRHGMQELGYYTGSELVSPAEWLVVHLRDMLVTRLARLLALSGVWRQHHLGHGMLLML